MPSRILIRPEEPKRVTARKIVGLAFPVIVVNLLYTLESMVSLILVSGISPSAVAGVGFSLNLLWFIYSLMAVSYTGVSVLIAQRVGAKKDPASVLFSGLFLSFLISIPVFLWGKEFTLHIMELFGTSEAVLEMASRYLDPIFLFITVGFLTNTYYGAFSGAGDTKTPMKVAVIMNLLNIGTSYLLINGEFNLPKLGVEGAGWGIVVAESFAFIVYTYLTFVKGKPVRLRVRLNRDDLLQIIRIGAPTAVERTITSLSFNIFVGFIARFGDHVLAGYQVGLRVESLSFMVGFGFMVASSVIAGQNYGARNFKGLIYGVNFIANFTALIMGALGILLIAFPKYLSLPFSRDPEVLKWAVYYLIIVGLSQVPMAYAVIFSGALKGMGKTKATMIINVSSFWIFRIIPSFIFLKLFPTPFVPWIFMTIEMFARALIFYLYYRKLRREHLENPPVDQVKGDDAT